MSQVLTSVLNHYLLIDSHTLQQGGTNSSPFHTLAINPPQSPWLTHYSTLPLQEKLKYLHLNV